MFRFRVLATVTTVTGNNPPDRVVRLLRGVFAGYRFPLSPRIRRLKAMLEKLEPPAAAVEHSPAPKPPAEPTHARRRQR